MSVTTENIFTGFFLLALRSPVSLGPRVPKLRPYGDGNANGCVLQAWTQFRTLVHRLAPQSYLRFAEEIVRSVGTRTDSTRRDARTLRHLPIRLPLLRRRNGYECFVEQKIVDDFQCAGHEERHID